MVVVETPYVLTNWLIGASADHERWNLVLSRYRTIYHLSNNYIELSTKESTLRYGFFSFAMNFYQFVHDMITFSIANAYKMNPLKGVPLLRKPAEWECGPTTAHSPAPLSLHFSWRHHTIYSLIHNVPRLNSSTPMHGVHCVLRSLFCSMKSPNPALPCHQFFSSHRKLT
jgi:hypothetical protein